MKPNNFRGVNKESNSIFENELEKNVCIYEYSKAAKPNMNQIPVRQFDCNGLEKTDIYDFDLRNDLNVKYPATSPNLLASFIKINFNEEITLNRKVSSQLFYFFEGKGKCNIKNKGILNYCQGDMLVLSYEELSFRADKNTVIYWVSDLPLLSYLNVEPKKQNFNSLLIRSDKMLSNINHLINDSNNLNKNRLGILLGNKTTDYKGTGTLTLTPILWSLLNIIPPNTIQKPHRHNSVALDLCVWAPDSGIYTLMGPELDEFGNVKNPVKCVWNSGCIFTTPPGWWHSHHNDTNEPGWVLPIQDAGLHTYMRTLDIQFVD